MARIHHDMPDDFNPAEDVCLPLVVPRDGEWIGVMVDLLHDPILTRYWQPEQARLEQDMVDAYYDRVLAPFVEAVVTQQYCSDAQTELGTCYRANTTSEVFAFYPNDPFTGEFVESAKSGLISGLKLVQWRDPNVEKSEIWKAIEDVFGFITGYRDSDIIVFPDVAALTTPIWEFKKLADIAGTIFNPFPYAKIDLEGTGQLEIELVNVPLGGAALIVPDAPTNLQDVVDLIVDFFDNDGSLPATWILAELDRDLSPPIPELVTTQTQELEFTSEGEHTVHVFFIPEIIPIPPFVRFSGGIREIEFCGNIQVIGQQTGNKYDEISIVDRTSIRGGVSTLMTCEDVKCGNIAAMEEMASRILLAMNSNNVRGSVDVQKQTDGSTNITLEETVRQLFEDVPEFPANDEIYGGLLIAEEKMTELAGEIVEGHVEGLSAQQVTDYLGYKYQLVDAAKTLTVVQAYYAELDLSNPVFEDFTGFATFSFCETQSRADLVGFVYDTINSLNTATVANALGLSALITYEQFSIWMDKGKKLPNNGYESSPCYLLPTQTKILQASDMFVQGGGQATERQELFDQYPSQGANERYAIRGSGYFTQISTGRRYNIYWHQDTQDNYISNDTRAIREKTASADLYPDPVNRADGNLTGYYTRSTAGWVGGLLFVNTPVWDLDDVQGSITIELINLGSA